MLRTTWALAAGVGALMLASCALSQSEQLGKISAPDVDPLNGTYIESVHVVMVQNAQAAQIVYSVNSAEPLTANSTRYTQPFDIYTVGPVMLRAMAISETQGRPDSVLTVRQYIIREGTKKLPEISPASDTVRGFVEVTLSISGDDSKMEYKTDLDDDFMPYTQPFIVDAIGHRTVSVRRAGGSGQTVVTNTYSISPPLRYDVSSTCEACGKKPARCAAFTVWLQGLRSTGRMFLTTARLGCERQTHMVEDTGIVDIDGLTSGYTFRSAGDKGNVFVCVQEGDSDFTVVSPRGSAEVPSFELQEAPESMSCHTLPPTPAPVATTVDYGENPGVQEANNFLSLGNVLFWTVIVCLVFVAMRAHRQRLANTAEWQRVNGRTEQGNRR